MNAQTETFPTLSAELWKDSGVIGMFLLMLTGVGLLTISAKVSIPFYPVPMTMQTFLVLVIGMFYGWKLGALTIASYLILGAFGFPVFQGTPEKGIGLAYMMGPTGGYLLGFFLAATLAGYLAEKGWDRHLMTTFLAMLAGNVVIYVPGLIWLGAVIGWDKPVFQWGLTPFIFADLAKVILAMVVIPFAWKAIKKK